MDNDILQRRINRVQQIHRLLNGPAVTSDDELINSTGHQGLPPPRTDLSTKLDHALSQRRSHYRFSPIPPSLDEISTLLHWTMGPQRTILMPDGTRRIMSMAPSAGGLPSMATFLASRPGGELPGGICRYDAERHRLDILRTGDPAPALRSALAQPEFADRAPLAIILVARMDTTLVKYPERHYRTLHIDAGIALQNLYLVTTALGLAGCAVTGFNDQAITCLLGLTDAMFPTVVFPLGRGVITHAS